MISLTRSVQGKTISTTILTLIMLNLVFWGAVKPTISQAISLHTQSQNYENIYNKLHTKNETITKVYNQYQDIKPQLKSLNYYFPYDGDFSLLIANLHKIAQDYGFSLQQISFSERITKQLRKNLSNKLLQLQPTTFTCELKGPLANLNAFITHWENTPFMPKVVNITYGAQTHARQSIMIMFVVYRLKYNLLAR